ncbi:two-component regulator propeller domain-containing protein [Prevotella herbatica]|nr:two-component regulator propeller domain-containing protein [Prevotella herbatica]
MKRLFIFLISMSAFISTFAQPAFVDKCNMSYLNMLSGLPSNFVDDIYSDSFGFIWISTHGGGLVRYDGFSYRYFGVGSDGMSLKSNTCHNVVEDRFHRLWISFEECTEVLDLKTMHSVMPKSKNDELKRIMAQMSVKVYCDSKGYIWIVERNDICRVEFDESGDVKDIIKFAYTNNTPDIAIADINNDGSVWAAIDGGLYKLLVSNHEIVRMDISPTFKDLPGVYVTSILNYQGSIWIGTNVGLMRYNSLNRQVKIYKNTIANTSLSHSYISALALSPDNHLVIGTLCGVDMYNPDTDDFSHWNMSSKINPLSSNFINCIYSLNGFLWVGTETGGIAQLAPRQLRLENFMHSDDPTSISPNALNAMYVEPNGTLWAGTVEGGLNRMERGKSSFTHFTTSNSALSHNSVSTLAVDGKRRLWVGTWAGGLNLVDLKTHRTVSRLNVPQKYKSLLNFIGALAYDKYNNIMWIGSNDGIFAYDLNTNTVFDPFNGNRDIRGAIGSIVDRYGYLWIGCVTGVVKINLKSSGRRSHRFNYVHITNKLDDPKSGIIDKLCAFCQTRNGTLWLGSNGYGLYKRIIDKSGHETFKAYTLRDGLANNSVKGIVEDNNGMLWITTENGLSQFNPKTETFTNYSANDGLLSSQFYWNSAVKSADGIIYLGSDKGLTILKGDNSDALYKGHLRFTRLMVDNEEIYAESRFLDEDISIAHEINIREGDKSLSIDFSSLNYGNENRGGYYYRMKGFEDDWIPLKPGEHSVRYTSLHSGSYQFEVKYSSAVSNGTGDVISIDVNVAPYFWKSWWFVSILLLVLTVLGKYLYEWRITELRRREAEKLMRPIEEAIRESDEPNKLQSRIEDILNNQRKFHESKIKSFEADKEELKLNNKPFIDDVIAILEKNYMNSEFGVGELADEIGMSRAVLSRKLSADTGLPTSQFIRNYRLGIAKDILIKNPGNRNITEIAYKVGFNDPKYFTRCFTRQYGSSPTTYKSE